MLDVCVKSKKVSLVTDDSGRNDSSDAVHLHYGLQYLPEIVLVHGSFGELSMEEVIEP